MEGKIGLQWFDTAEDSMHKENLNAIEEWVQANADNIHDIFHYVVDSEIEASKIIDGKQEKDAEGRIKISSYELYFFSNLMLIVYSEETQDLEKSEVLRKVKYLGELSMECGEP